MKPNFIFYLIALGKIWWYPSVSINVLSEASSDHCLCQETSAGTRKSSCTSQPQATASVCLCWLLQLSLSSHQVGHLSWWSPAASPYIPPIAHALSDKDLLVNLCLPSLNQSTQNQTPKIQKNTMAQRRTFLSPTLILNPALLRADVTRLRHVLKTHKISRKDRNLLPPGDTCRPYNPIQTDSPEAKLTLLNSEAEHTP